MNGNPGSKIIDITGHNYFQDLVRHVETKLGVSSKKEEEKKVEKEDSDSPRAQLAALEQKADSGAKITVREHAHMILLKRIVRAA